MNILKLFSNNIDKSKEFFSKKQVLMLNNITLDIATTLNIDILLEKSADALLDSLKLYGSVLFLFDTDTQSVYTKSISQSGGSRIILKLLGINNILDKLKVSIDEKDNLIVDSIVNNKYNISNELWRYSKGVVNADLSKKIQLLTSVGSFISVPVNFKGDTIGAILFSKKERNYKFAYELPIMEIFASQIGIAIGNARAYTKIQDQLNIIKEKNNNLQTLFNLSSSIFQSLSIDTVIKNAVNLLSNDIRIIGTCIGTINNNIYEIRDISEGVLKENWLKNYKLDITKITSDKLQIYNVIKNQKGEFTDDLTNIFEEYSSFLDLAKIIDEFKLKSIATFPLIGRDNLLGTITFFLKIKKDSPIYKDLKQLLKTYSAQISIALENSLLFEKIKKTSEDLANARQQEKDMVDVMGHELRTPLAIVRNAVVVLQAELEHYGSIEKEKLKKYLDMAVESARREVKLLETLLSATKLENNRVQATLTKVDLLDVIHDSIEGNRDRFKRKELEIIYTPPQEDIFVYADRIRIQEVMDNYLSNAIKYTPKGSITIIAKVENNMGRVDVIDTGLGIEKEDISKLGKKFFRAKGLYNGEIAASGTGLGLYVTFGLIEIMNGKKEIKSKVGKGSKFSFLIPIYQGQEDKLVDQTFE
jgi:signal transduction histidine kinase